MLQPPTNGSISRIETAAEFRGNVTARLQSIEDNQKELMQMLAVVHELQNCMNDLKEGNKKMNILTLLSAGIIGAVSGLISGKGLLALWAFMLNFIK